MWDSWPNRRPDSGAGPAVDQMLLYYRVLRLTNVKMTDFHVCSMFNISLLSASFLLLTDNWLILSNIFDFLFLKLVVLLIVNEQKAEEEVAETLQVSGLWQRWNNRVLPFFEVQMWWHGVLMAKLVTHVAWGEVNNTQSLFVMAALQGPSDAGLWPSSPRSLTDELETPPPFVHQG